VHDGVALPRHGGGGVGGRPGVTAPQIDLGLAAHRDAHRRADLAALGEVALELLTYPGEPVRTEA
jgi:hypothetical protein